jgi:hypothetical protein
VSETSSKVASHVTQTCCCWWSLIELLDCPPGACWLSHDKAAVEDLAHIRRQQRREIEGTAELRDGQVLGSVARVAHAHGLLDLADTDLNRLLYQETRRSLGRLRGLGTAVAPGGR